jgi:hypothetical protein
VSEEQLDLFAHACVWVAQPFALRSDCPVVAADFNDAALVAAIPDANLADCSALAAEAGRRQLAAAVPALAALCQRFAGFGACRAIPEQVAALEGLALIGGRDAARAAARMIERAVVLGPTLSVAVRVAAQLGATLSASTLRSLLRHSDPTVRAGACRCARAFPEVISLLVGLLDDLDPIVAKSAAFALGQMGRKEAGPILKRLLRDAPSPEVIDSVVSIADEECVVLLGRIARSVPELTAAALDGLDDISHPCARAVAAAIRHREPGGNLD